MRCRRSLLASFALIAASFVAPPASADQVVYFVNGKAIMVKSVERGEKFTVLEMDGGGRIGVPTDQIARIEDFVVSVPSATQPTVPVAPVAPVVQQPSAAASGAQGGAPSNLPPASPMAPGPGIGGLSTVPNAGIAGLKPLELGGNGASPAVIPRPLPPGQAGAVSPGPGNPFLGNGAARPNNFAPGRQFPGRLGMFGGRGGRSPEQNRPAPPPPPAAQNAQPARSAPPQMPAPSVQPPPSNPAPQEAPPPPDDSDNDSSDQNAPQEGEPSGDSPGSAS